MIKKFLKRLGYEKVTPAKPVEEKKERPRQVFTTDDFLNNQERIEELWKNNFQKVADSKIGQNVNFAMDNQLSTKGNFNNFVIPESQVLWYSSQTFIGYQLCAMLAQNWLISKACLMPAKDATRNGYEIKVCDGSEVSPEIMDDIKKFDNLYQVNKNLIEFVQMGRVFGIRVAMFIVESDDPDYYRNPFNPDGVQPGSYRGISQIDPYWITPQLDAEASGNPASINFYVPTWWNINGRLVHRSHLVIYKTEEVADILKPTYIYGGISIPQKIAERVYAAERTANEAPMLALTKRTDVIKADMVGGTANYPGLVQRIQEWVFNRDNYGVKILGLDEEMQQFDTTLSDFDQTIMTQYQLVAAASNVPAVKLLGTSPKGFNATGEHEEANYHEELESIQTHDLTPLLNRHHLLLIRSEIAPKYNIAPFEVSVNWKSLDAMTERELAEVNFKKAETGRMLMESGAIDGEEERNRIINDPDSGYSGLATDPIDDTDDDIETEFSDLSGA